MTKHDTPAVDRIKFIYCLVLCLQHLLDVKSLRYLSSVTLHDRITKSLLHLHKKKKPPSISAQFQVSVVIAPCWKIGELQKQNKVTWQRISDFSTQNIEILAWIKIIRIP